MIFTMAAYRPFASSAAAAVMAATSPSNNILSRTVALVTGGNSGLGAAATRHLLQHGARVVVADLDSTTFDKAYQGMRDDVGGDTSSVPNLRILQVPDGTEADSPSPPPPPPSLPLATGPAVAFCQTDVTDESQVSAALDACETLFGEPVSTAISCAGVALASKTYSVSKGPHSASLFETTWRVNTLGTFHVSRLAAERMATRELNDDRLRGCLIHTASIAAYEGQMGQVAYSASKGAIVGMTLPMARDLAPLGIRVVTIAPGLFETPLLEGLPPAVKDALGKTVPCPNRLGRPDEFGDLVGAILTINSLNGCVLRLDGALRMPP